MIPFASTSIRIGVRLLSGKVCVEFGCPFSAIIAGMEWAAPQARIVNMSLGGGPTDGSDPLSRALDALAVEHGTLFVVAAGNFGAPQTVSAPASAREALAVGSVDKTDTMSAFSSRGPRGGRLRHQARPGGARRAWAPSAESPPRRRTP
jgi:subtilisin family serine protease